MGVPLDLPPETHARMDTLGQEFLAEFLGLAARRHPEDFELLAELAGVLTRLGRYREGLDADRRLAEMAPGNPTARS